MERDTPLEEVDYFFKTGSTNKDASSNITNGELAVDTTVKMVVGDVTNTFSFTTSNISFYTDGVGEERNASK